MYLLSLRARNIAVTSEAMGNAVSVSYSLMEFESEYGIFPDATTAPLVKSTTATPLTLGSSSSNQLFRQLLATSLKSEKPFYAAIKGSRRPDDLFHDDAHALEPGECGFAYIAGLHSGMHPDTPVLVSPLIPGTTRFDPKPFRGKAIVLRLGISPGVEPIDSSGRIMIGGKDLFDPSQPWWRGKMPDIKWQE